MAQLSTPGRGRHRKLHIDMTPMVDLAFLLLTFFVLTMTLNGQYTLPMQMPEQNSKADPPPVKRERVLTLYLGKADLIHYTMASDGFKTTSYGPGGIRKVLNECLSRRPDLVVLIKPTNASRYQNLVDIIDEMDIRKMKWYYLDKETADDRALLSAYLTEQ